MFDPNDPRMQAMMQPPQQMPSPWLGIPATPEQQMMLAQNQASTAERMKALQGSVDNAMHLNQPTPPPPPPAEKYPGFSNVVSDRLKRIKRGR